MNSKPFPGDQLALPFSVFERFEFDSFQPGEQVDVITSLKLTAKKESSQNIFLWGKKGSGKSHLLQATCSLASDEGNTAAFIPLAQAQDFSVELLVGLELQDLICIDDLECIANNDEWELALFRLFNERRENNRPTVFSASKSPKGIDIRLPDLKSRLSWDLVLHLSPIDEKSLINALKNRANSRMFDLPDEVIHYLVNRVARDTHTLFDMLDLLDRASLQSGKKITVPFVKSLLKIKEQ